MRTIHWLALSGAATILSMQSLAMAGNNLELGLPGYGGSGCPQGTVSATLSPDQTQLSLLFDQFIAVDGRHVTDPKERRKSCNISIPVTVPNGYMISIYDIDYRGYVRVPRGGQAVFNAEYFFADRSGPRISVPFNGPVERDYLIEDGLAVESLVWSRCGASTNLRVNASMRARTNRSGDDVTATVDSTDVSAGVVYHIRWKRCT